MEENNSAHSSQFLDIGEPAERDQTHEFWLDQAKNIEASVFPTPPSPSHVVHITQASRLGVRLNHPLPPNRTFDIITRTAWAILLGQYTQSSDVVFGSIGRHADPETDQVHGKAAVKTTVGFVRVVMGSQSTLGNLIQQLENQERAIRSMRPVELDFLRNFGPDLNAACGFQSALLSHSGEPLNPQKEADQLDPSFTQEAATEPSIACALILECQTDEGSVTITARYDPIVISHPRTVRVLQQLANTLNIVCDPKHWDTPLSSLELAGHQDFQDMCRWNSDIPPAVEACIHELIGKTVKRDAEAPAVCAWDGELTYAELDVLSTGLAYHLAGLGVDREVLVPICFEKSYWTPVAMLGVMKAGGAFVLLDSSHPDDRLHSICRNVDAPVVVTSPQNAARFSSIVAQTVTLDARSRTYLPTVPSRDLSSSSPTDAAYVIFTSGSLGAPKGCKIEHRSYASASSTHGPVMRICSTTRSLQFGSYSFAGAIMEMLMPLIHGGCVCIPSEEQRRTGLAAAIQDLQANWAFLTPTVLAYLDPDEVSCLKTICIGGEPIRTSQIQQWSGRVHLRQTYGSAETSAVVSSADINTSSSSTDVGAASTARYWIVDSTNPERLMPVGAAGEVLIEGPVIGREYICLPEKTTATFIAAPSWRANFRSREAGWRFYRTGDMGTLSTDGTLKLLGRKDTQVKLRGQRIELGEIEHHARTAHPLLKECIVELVRPRDESAGAGTRAAMLVAFLVVEAPTADAQRSRDQAAIDTLRHKLENALPQYMVPSAYVPVQALPLTVTGKMDRRKLREIGSQLTKQQLLSSERGVALADQVTDFTDSQLQLRDVWAAVLEISPDKIRPDSNFMHLGGDSLEMTWLVAAARERGFKLTISDVMRHPVLHELADCLSPTAAVKP